MTKLHIEAPAPRGTLFSIEPALCGRRQPTDYRMYFADDAVHRRAARPFFADRPRKATCKSCLRHYHRMLRWHRSLRAA